MGADLLSRVIGLVRPALIKLVDDNGEQQTAQVSISVAGPDGVEEVIDHVPRLGEYGFYSNPPVGSECVVAFLGGRRSMGLILATGWRAQRPKGLKPGEAMVFNAVRGQYVDLADDGNIKSQAPDFQHDGDMHLTGKGYAAEMHPANGWTGTFATGDARTVHVTDGIITNVA
jgi:phage gp45-like